MPKMTITEARDAFHNVADRAMRDPEISKYVEGVKRVKPHMDAMGLATIAVTLENTRGWVRQMMRETSTSAAVGNFINYGFELITALMPNLTANDFISVQPMNRKSGEVFYMKYTYGTSKGSIAAGSDMFGVFQAGQGGEIYYTSETVHNEVCATGNGGTKHYAFVLKMIPVVADGAVSITDGVEIFTDVTGSGVLVGDAGGTGTVSYTSGAVVIDFFANVVNLVNVTSTYSINFEQNPDNIPEVDYNVWSDPITAKARKIRAKYTLDSMYDLQQAFGRAVDSDLVSACAADVRAEMDAEFYRDLYTGAFDTVTTWDRNMPMGVSWEEHKKGIRDVVVAGKNLIFKNTLKATGNFMIAGVNVCTVIESLTGNFRSTQEKPLSGPYVIGYLDDMPVVKNPFYPDDEYVIGYKGSMFLDVGYVYAPYMPLFTTPPVTLDDMTVRRGLGTRYAKKMVNNRMFVKGEISGAVVPTPAP
jgi:hypothetical protein